MKVRLREDPLTLALVGLLLAAWGMVGCGVIWLALIEPESVEQRTQAVEHQHLSFEDA